MSTLENIELLKFHTSIQEEVKALMVNAEEGTTPEETFTDIALTMLSDSGETENYRLCYDEKVSKRGIEHKINAYALSENYETLDLFITIYNGLDSIQSVSKTEVDRAIDRLLKFFRNAVYKDYVSFIEPSSEIYDLAHTIANAPEIKEFLTRVNIYLISDGEIKTEYKSSEKISNYTLFYRIIDLNYLFNISEKSRIPIEINFEENGFGLPCIVANFHNDEYQSYLSVIPGEILAKIYEQYGSRLLEQNVRSFLQFTGKINKGIKKTILTEPHMFLAFNNGIAATAEEVRIVENSDNNGVFIGYVKDFQIVNGGQTTASIYHTWKKDKADISQIFVPIKLSVVKKKEKFSDIVSRISEYANTQNKVSVVDLSSNKPSHIALEKLSRNIWASPKKGETQQTIWFYERARGQYRNELLKYGFTKTKRKAFETKYPKNQVFTKDHLAKYVNSWQEIYDGKKLVIGPHFVVRGNQKNYIQFINYNFDKKPDNIFYEDTIAKAILFRTAEKIYGVKPNSIGDLRYLTVPYSIAWIGYKTHYKLDLYTVWKNQGLSESMMILLKDIMIKVEDFIKSNAPGSLYSEWAKKEDCWFKIREENFELDLSPIDELMIKSSSDRYKISEREINKLDELKLVTRLTSVHHNTWKKIQEWGYITKHLNHYLQDIAESISKHIKHNKKLNEFEIENGNRILDIVIEKAPELFFDLDYLNENEQLPEQKIDPEKAMELIKKLLSWDFVNKRLQDYEYEYLNNLSKLSNLTDSNIKTLKRLYYKAKSFGFKI